MNSDIKLIFFYKILSIFILKQNVEVMYNSNFLTHEKINYIMC